MVRFAVFMEIAQFMASVYFAEYSVSVVWSLCVVLPLTLILQLSVRLVQSHLNPVILTLFTMVYPCVRKISAGVSILECIVAELSLFH